MHDVDEWALGEFGGAELGDRRRTGRLVALAAEVARRPAGRVTQACRSSATREGAFRWLENPAVRVEALEEATRRATVHRCRFHRRVIVAVDSTSLKLTDTTQSKDFGAVGRWTNRGRGVHVMTAFAVSCKGVALGIAGQRMWVRERRSRRPEKAHSEAYRGENRFWMEVLESTHQSFSAQAPETEAFFQLDRGADCWPILSLAAEQGLLLTVRAAHNRRVDESAGLLRDQVERTKVRDFLRINVRARPRLHKKKRLRGRRFNVYFSRRARIAQLEIRATPVTLLLVGDRRVSVNAVLVRERNRRGYDRIEWLLLSTHPIQTKQDLRAIVHSYAQRWRVEDLHRTWKRGLCRVEDTQLRSKQAVFKWASILASVASRAMHLTHLARREPDLPATEELTRYELEALIALRQPKGVKIGDEPTLGQAVRWLADLGGYVGPWNGPPGATVIGRGLDDVLAAAAAFENRDKMR
jgi:transposase-like protein/DDE family transposase